MDLTEISGACQRFYEIFDVWPGRVEIHWRRQRDLARFVVHPLVQIPSASFTEEESPQPMTLSETTIPIEPTTGILWDEFRLYHPAIGSLTPNDLAINAATVKRMIELKGYKAITSELLVDGAPSGLETLFIQKGKLSLSWAFGISLYKQELWQIKYDIERQLHKFASFKPANGRQAYLVIRMRDDYADKSKALLVQKLQEKLQDGDLIGTLYQEQLTMRQLEWEIKAAIGDRTDVIPVLVYADDGYDIGCAVSNLVTVASVATEMTGNRATNISYEFSYLGRTTLDNPTIILQ